MMADDAHHHHSTSLTTTALPFLLHPHHHQEQQQQQHDEQQLLRAEDENGGGGEEVLLGEGLDGPNHPTTFSQLLFSNHDEYDQSHTHNDINSIYNIHTNTIDLISTNTTTTSTSYPPQMLCFGPTTTTTSQSHNQGVRVLFSPQTTTTPSPQTNFSNRKIQGSTQEQSRNTVAGEVATNVAPLLPEARQRAAKKSRTDKPTPSPRFSQGKRSLEKGFPHCSSLFHLLERLTDTASVLHEAMGYIRFLQDQIQVLCSPYLQPPPEEGRGVENEGLIMKKGKKELLLRSRGLCLVPVECTIHVANTNNGADFWSPSAAAAAAAMGTNNHIITTAASASSCFLPLPTTQ
ncbi:Transcription factor bHLH113 [Linum perenne]